MPKRVGSTMTSGRHKYWRTGDVARDALLNAGIAAATKGVPKLVTLAARKLGEAAIASAKGGSMVKYRTAGQRKQRRYRSSIQKGESAGFFTKTAKKDPFKLYTKNGVVLTREVGIICTGQQASRPIIIGHSSHGNYHDIRLLFFRGIVREVFNKAGVQILDMETDSPGDYTLIITYVQASAQNTDLAQTFNTSGISYVQLANAILTAFNGITENVQSLQGFYIESAELRIGASRMSKIDYRDSTVNILSKASLKIQNRTIAAGTDDDNNSTENIANQPLYGKMYTGKGNGLITRVDSGGASIGKALLCSEFRSNVLAYAPGTYDYWLDEVPLPTLFEPKPKFSPARIEPGHIKTSVLQGVWRCKQIDFWKMLATNNQSADNQFGKIYQGRYGKFAIFALEKMICVTASDTVPIIGAESNMRMGLMFEHKRYHYTAEIVEDQQFITQVNGANAP